MPAFLSRIIERAVNPHSTTTQPRTATRALRRKDALCFATARGTTKAEIPNVDLKSETHGHDPLAIYKPTGKNGSNGTDATGSRDGGGGGGGGGGEDRGPDPCHLTKGLCMLSHRRG
jgi:hypothetical protein